MRKTVQIASLLVGTALLGGVAMSTWAVDGVILVDQNKAMAGNVTPGDAPGFPVTISLPGSYRLAGNLTVPDANTTAIVVNADNVTIDLNGFSIIGPVVCTGFPVSSCSATGTGDGVHSEGHLNTTVVNGSVRGMGNFGISMLSGGGYVEKVRASSNGGVGIFVLGGGTLIGNTVIGNGGIGIGVTQSTLSGNMVSGNRTQGISASCPSSLVGNTAIGNGLSNLEIGGSGCAVANNAAPGSNAHTVLLIPFVTQHGASFDTSISIANTTSDPLGSAPISGVCSLNYFGNTEGGGPAPPPQTTNAPVAGGQSLSFGLFFGGNFGIQPTPGFQGYIIARCNFPGAHGIAFVSDLGALKVAFPVPVLVLSEHRGFSDSEVEALGQ